MKKVKHVIALLTAVLSLFSMRTIALESAPVTFACNYFPPQKMTTPEQSAQPGYDVEIITESMKSIQMRSKFEYFPWKRAYDLVKHGQKDALCSCSYLPEREADFLFSEPTGQAVTGVFYRAEDATSAILSLKDLRGRHVAVVKGYNLEAELEKAQIGEFETVSSDKLLLNLLQYHRVDYIYSYESTIRYEMKHMADAPQLQFSPIGKNPYFVCFSKLSPRAMSLRDGFNSALQKLKSSGRYDEIIGHYTSP